MLAARLASEGIEVELRGGLGGAYGLTVGDLARVDLFVPEDQIDDARLVLLADEIDAAMDPPDAEGDPALTASPWLWAAAMALVLVAVLAPVLRLLAS